jgi:signal transduction histidine kinase
MLGRQQIAGIPTAISELFKNAHDAYADQVEVDYFRNNGLFVMRDDGLGMSSDDFQKRWLVLGTESKVENAPGVGPLFEDPTKKKRPVLGEKGIGRLAIAAIGSQVLILTRAKAVDGIVTELVAAFVHWGLFGLPGIDLEEIEIPLRTLPSGQLPSAMLVHEMVSEAKANLQSVASGNSTQAVAQIIKEMDCFRIDPIKLDSILGRPSLSGDGHGTHFFIYPVAESLAPALDAPLGDADAAPPLFKMLVGFTNTMTPDHSEPVIKTAFRDHKTSEIVDDVIEESEFFTPDEFENADHHIQGEFDEYGQFAGAITVFGEPTANYVVPWPAKAQPTDCGQFRLNLAVVQGVASQSTVPNEDWARIIRKMNRIGGLYIYRDGIRVLPYGNNDYDFLNIEKNRTKSAGYYYFSYRRIFGVIEIDRAHNAHLQEKAGREGFRENQAYQQFRDILMNFFVQVAADFFREGSAKLGRYDERREEMSRLDKAKRLRERQVSVRRNEFRQRLSVRSADIAEGRAAESIGGVISDLERNLTIAESESDLERSSHAFIEAEVNAREQLSRVRDEYRITPPRGVGMPQALRRDYDAYRQEYEHFITAVADPMQLRIEQVLAASTGRAKGAIDRRVRFDRALTDVTALARKTTQAESQEARNAADDVQQRVGELARTSIQVVEKAVGDVLSRAARLDVSKLDDESFVARRTELENDVEHVAEETRALLNSAVEHLRSIAIHLKNEPGEKTETTPLDAEEALEEELIALRERSEADLELAQLGIAVQVINHEFDATIRGVRRNIRELRAWADANDNMRKLYESIRDNFSHLDGYLTLFTPLQRRLYRSAVNISGTDIQRFLEDLFAERLKRHKVELQATTRFKKYVLLGYPSTFYPVFVNLVDNAIYWVSRSSGTRIIRLDATSQGLIVADSGPGVDERDRDVIFDFGFTRKPGGRGLGLHISRDVLRRANYVLSIDSQKSDLGGAQFEIRPADKSIEEAVVPVGGIET